MPTMCAACIGLLKNGPACSCGGKTVDKGPVSDYFGPYSPYFNMNFEDPRCVHLYKCQSCGKDRRIAVSLREV